MASLEQKNNLGKGTLEYGGHIPYYLKLVLSKKAEKFLKDKQKELEDNYDVKIEPPSEYHITVILGDELQSYDIREDEIKDVVGRKFDIIEYGNIYRYNTPSDGFGWVIPVQEYELVALRRELGLPEKMPWFENYSFHMTVGYEIEESRIARISEMVR